LIIQVFFLYDVELQPNYGFFSRSSAAFQTFRPTKNQEFSSTYRLEGVSLNAIVRIAALADMGLSVQVVHGIIGQKPKETGGNARHGAWARRV
jgi:hypothetical protein